MARNTKLATIADYARQDFEPWSPGSINMIGDRAKWIRRVNEDYIGICLAVAVMERTPEQLAAFQDAETAKIAVETAASLHEMSERYKGLADMLMGAHVRMLSGVARYTHRYRGEGPMTPLHSPATDPVCLIGKQYGQDPGIEAFGLSVRVEVGEWDLAVSAIPVADDGWRGVPLDERLPDLVRALSLMVELRAGGSRQSA